ncbi:unnamed protein product [Enterobius vermicularis]|uniref:Recep_L_domain domain-containing protein n=1 Tax=Enterobius vermicularis TaxID=51028 RepID=A0A0N4VJ50_ENTVE|nr:unnamed protein product [Enterobius vermicularis]
MLVFFLYGIFKKVIAGLQVTVGESEVVLVGTLVKLIFDLKDNYFGLYDQVSEIDSAAVNADLLRGGGCEDVFTVENFRPTNVRFCFRLLKSLAHCAIHCHEGSYFDSDECPILTVNEFVVELVKEPLGAIVQINVGAALVQFGGYSLGEHHQGGFMSLDTFSFRAQGFYSEIDVPWDVSSVEYAWLTEVVLGRLSGCFTPGQVLLTSDFLESLLLLSLSPDEQLFTPSRYHLCQHFNDINTCSRSALCLIDGDGKVQNCESEEKVSVVSSHF